MQSTNIEKYARSDWFPICANSVGEKFQSSYLSSINRVGTLYIPVKKTLESGKQVVDYLPIEKVKKDKKLLKKLNLISV